MTLPPPQGSARVYVGTFFASLGDVFGIFFPPRYFVSTIKILIWYTQIPNQSKIATSSCVVVMTTKTQPIADVSQSGASTNQRRSGFEEESTVIFFIFRMEEVRTHGRVGG
jgi:hypothetical protein